MTMIKWMGVGLTAALLAGCGQHRIEELRNTTPSGGTPFTQALTGEYRAFTLEQADRERDWPNSYIFADRGLKAAHGDAILPVDPARWRVRAADLPPLQDGRGRLLQALDGGGRERLPQVAARAQVSYDCWVEETEERWDQGAIDNCHNAFEQALAQLTQVRVVETPPPAPPPAPVAQQEFIVYFAWDSAKLDGAAAQIISQVAERSRNNTGTRIALAGHTDLSGSADYNLRLSLRRADAVRQALIAQGISADRMQVTALGETQPAVPTAAGVREPRNRRVVVDIR